MIIEEEIKNTDPLKIIQDKTTNSEYIFTDANFIIDILNYLKDKQNKSTDKQIIIKYLTDSITNLPFNTDILLSLKVDNKQLYHILIYEYITNYEDKEYQTDLKNCFAQIIKNTSYDKSIYQYIISFISNYVNKKSILTDENKDKLTPEYFEEEIDSKDFNANHMQGILDLLNSFYESCEQIIPPNNYYYFSGKENQGIILNNQKNILDFIAGDINILLYVKFFDKKFIGKFDKLQIINIKLTGEKSISLYVTPESQNSTDTEAYVSYESLKLDEMNKILIKINTSSKVEIMINDKQVEFSNILYSDQKIESLELFNKFIGICSSIMIFKNNTEGNMLPKFLNKDIFKCGIHKEEIFAQFIKAHIMNEVDDKNMTDKLLVVYKGADLPEIKTFFENHLISVFIPTRFDKSDDGKIITVYDSISGLNGVINYESPFSGLHVLDNTIKAFYSIGSINHLLPIIELMIQEQSLLNLNTFNSFMSLLTFIFSKLSYLFQLFDKNSKFFFHFSHFLEKIPQNLFSSELCQKLKELTVVFSTNKDDINYIELNEQFMEYILLNTKILLKFSYAAQKEIIEQIIKYINLKSKIQIFININIIRIINILLHYDGQRYNKYCCKKHKEYFTNAKDEDVMNPELNEIAQPIFSLLNELLNRYLEQFKILSDTKLINDYNLDKLFDLLTYDISPCLQKTILQMFFELKSKPKQLLFKLNKDRKMMYVLLFLVRTSVFDEIKLLAYDFAMLLSDENFSNEEKNPSITNANRKIRQYIEYHILPYYLLVDENEKDANVNSAIDENKYIKDFDINKKIKYNYLVPTPQQVKLKHNYSKEKLDGYMDQLFDKIYKNFTEGKKDLNFCLNILVRIASKTDVTSAIKFLDKMKEELDVKNTIDSPKQKEIYLNKPFLHYLLEVCFHSYLLKDILAKGGKDEHNLGLIFSKDLSEEGIKSSTTKIFEKSHELLIRIFTRSIYKLDYMLTWAKYYFEINKEERSVFYKIRTFIHEELFEKIFTNLKEVSVPNILALPEQRQVLYFYNLIFEYYTYFRIVPFINNANIKDTEALYQEISILFRHNIINDLKKEYKEQYSEDKITELPFYKIFKKIMSYFQKIWSETKKVEKDKDFYFTYLYHKENVYINDLEILFFTFDNLKALKSDSSANKGIPLIILLYHQFTLFLSLIQDKNEFKELLKNFRLLISLVIISSCTLTVAKSKGNVPSANSTIKADQYKTLWPNEFEYTEIQKQVKLFLFNCFYFLYFRIVEIDEYIKKNQGNQSKLDNLNAMKRYIFDTLAYFLRLLNGLLKDRKKHEDNKNKKTIKSFFRAIKHKIITTLDGINLAGPFMFILEFFEKCFIRYKPNNNDNFDVTNFIINKTTFMDEIPIFNIEAFNDDTNPEYGKIYPKIEAGAVAFVTDPNIKAYLNENFFEYQKPLFPFIRYIINRRTLAGELLPTYNNSIYCKAKYNNICLIPNYFPYYPYYKDIVNHLEKANKILTNEIRIIEIKTNIERYDRISKYYKIKKKLFSFFGLWSKEQFFYEPKKYGLKYKIFNHLTDDYTKIFLTPIIDIDYYLPKFNSFDTKDLFRSDNEKVALPKITDLSSDIFNLENIVTGNELETKQDKELYEEEKDGEENKEEVGLKDEEVKEEKVEGNKIVEEKIDEEKIDEDKKGNEIKEEKKEEEKEKENKEKEKDDEKDVTKEDKKEDELNNLYLLKKIGYQFTDNVDVLVRDPRKYFELFKFYVRKINNIIQKSNTLMDICCMVKSSYHVRGIFYNNTKEIGFYGFDHIPFISKLEYDQDRKACFGSAFKQQKKKYNGYHLVIPYHQIAYVIKRRYFFKEIAIEVFTAKNKSYLFKLHESSIKKILANLRTHMKTTMEEINVDGDKIGFVNYNTTNNPFINTNILKYKNKEMNLKNLYDKWANWEISTFKFLMMLNLYSSRSLNDINQYPVFPWILTNYVEKDYKILKEDKNLLRPFELPMGMMEVTASSQIRKKTFLEEWQKEKEGEKPILIGRYKTHYSNPFYVSYYLVRNFPFVNIRIELQGSKWDDPNKQFNDLENSFNLALIQKNDLRELIPEMFCFPEMFMNTNNLNLGETTELPEGENNEENQENNQIVEPKPVNDVKLPEWANNNAYNFIKKHREFLESPEVSEKINEWFNIIFGSKQKGQQAEKINNLFMEQSYDDFGTLYHQYKDEEKIEFNKNVQLGMTPSQILTSNSLKRKSLDALKSVKQLLYNTLKALEKGEEAKFLELAEMDIPYVEEEPFKIFDSIKKGYLKWRIYILGKHNIRIFKKIEQKVEKTTKTAPTPAPLPQNVPKPVVENNEIIENPENVEKKENVEVEEKKENVEVEEKKENVEVEEKKEVVVPEEKKVIDNLGVVDKKEEKIEPHIETAKQNLKKINVAKKYVVKLPEYKYRLESENNYYNCSAIFGKGFYMALGGYFNGNVIVKTLDYNAKPKDISKTIHVYSTNECSPITNIVIDETETFAICGNKLGTVFIFVISQQQKSIWKISKILNSHKEAISSIAVSANLNMFITCSKDGYCMLYSLPRIKLFNSFKISKQQEEEEDPNQVKNQIIYPTITLIYDAPLPCFVFYIKSLKQFYVYSINGQFLTKNKLDYDIVNNGIAKYVDNQCRDYLFIYNPIDKTIDIHKAIDFELVIKSPTIKYKLLVLKDKDNELRWK